MFEQVAGHQGLNSGGSWAPFRLALDGVNDELRASCAVTGNTARTIEVWVRTQAAATAHAQGTIPLFSSGVRGTANQDFSATYYGNASAGSCYFHMNLWGAQDFNHFTTMPAGALTHFAATYDQANMYFHLNGTLVKTQPVSGLSTAAGLLLFGADNSGVHGLVQFAGGRVWDVARTTAQIQATRNILVMPGATGLVEQWPLTEGNGTIADGTSATNYPLTLANGPTWVLNN